MQRVWERDAERSEGEMQRAWERDAERPEGEMQRVYFLPFYPFTFLPLNVSRVVQQYRIAQLLVADVRIYECGVYLLVAEHGLNGP